MTTNSAEKMLLDSHLKTLQLVSFRQQYEAVALEATQQHHSYERYLLALAEQEVADRQVRRRRRLLKEAKLPVVKQLAEFDFTAIPAVNSQQVWQLADGGYIDKREPIILIGNPGLGKTHIATSLAFAATQQMRRVRFFNVAALVGDLLTAQKENRVTQLIHRLQRYHLLVFDELGFIPFTANGAQLMFQLCSALYEQTALIITTNLAFSDWTQVFGDERLTVALLDRLTHRAHIIEFTGESYRFRQRKQRQT